MRQPQIKVNRRTESLGKSNRIVPIPDESSCSEVRTAVFTLQSKESDFETKNGYGKNAEITHQSFTRNLIFPPHLIVTKSSDFPVSDVSLWQGGGREAA